MTTLRWRSSREWSLSADPNYYWDLPFQILPGLRWTAFRLMSDQLTGLAICRTASRLSGTRWRPTFSLPVQLLFERGAGKLVGHYVCTCAFSKTRYYVAVAALLSRRPG